MKFSIIVIQFWFLKLGIMIHLVQMICLVKKIALFFIYLGSLNLNLNNFALGTRNSTSCSLSAFENSKEINFIKCKRSRGWWPFSAVSDDGTKELAGKLEMEIEIFTSEDAILNPAGKGRDEPQALPLPQ